MRFRTCFFVTLFLIFGLFGCKKSAELPLAGAPTGKPSETARIREGNMLLRGIDDERLNSLKLPNPYSDYVYVVQPGHHKFMGMNIQTGHFISPSDLRCYSLEAEVLPGVDYILQEDKEKELAILRREDNQVIVATGEKYEQKDAYVGPCTWGK